MRQKKPLPPHPDPKLQLELDRLLALRSLGEESGVLSWDQQQELKAKNPRLLAVLALFGHANWWVVDWSLATVVDVQWMASLHPRLPTWTSGRVVRGGKLDMDKCIELFKVKRLRYEAGLALCTMKQPIPTETIDELLALISEYTNSNGDPRAERGTALHGLLEKQVLTPMQLNRVLPWSLAYKYYVGPLVGQPYMDPPLLARAKSRIQEGRHGWRRERGRVKIITDRLNALAHYMHRTGKTQPPYPRNLNPEK